MSPERWQQIERLYHAALNRPAGERPAYLREHCAGDDILYCEVESLLRNIESNGFLERRAIEVVAEEYASPTLPDVTGQMLGPYEVMSRLGRGGMGEVYKARDTRLKRAVAIKISATHFTDRFEREARAVAAINHPNICTLYDVGPNYLVMELVEGQTLGERIARGPIALDEVLSMSLQMADALNAAHTKGIIHRDLKPSNVKITADGVVKVLDFGLSKVADSSNPELPTESISATRPGMVLGTAPYMSPEQARGEKAEKRADIWSFGVVVYEMATGQQPFARDTISGTLAAVQTFAPDLNRVPPVLRSLVRACLEKDAKRRLHDIADVVFLLDRAPQAVGAQKRLSRAAFAGVCAITAAIILWFGWLVTRPSKSVLQPLIRLEVDLGRGVSLGSVTGSDVAISPDGTRLAYLSNLRLFTKQLNASSSSELVGTEEAQAPFFSPDSQWIAFGGPEGEKKVPVQGGGPILLSKAPSFYGASWSADGNFLLTLENDALGRIPPAGGNAIPVTELAPGEVAHGWPQVLPGGKGVLFTAYTKDARVDEARIQILVFGDRRPKTLHRGGTYGRYLPSGHLVFVHEGALFAMPFDIQKLEVRGTPVRILDDVAYNTQLGSAQFDFSQTGIFVYRSRSAGNGLRTVQWLDNAGRTERLLDTPGDYLHPQLSPDGGRLALQSGGDVWVLHSQPGTLTRTTFEGGVHPVWTPDSKYILFPKLPTGGMFYMAATGSGVPRPLMPMMPGRYFQWPCSFTADGRLLAYEVHSPETSRDIWTVSLYNNGSRLQAHHPEVFLRSSFDERHPAISPDGRWLAYVSNESGRFQVYVQAFPAKSGKWQISNHGGMYPVWSRSSRELFFRTMDNQIMVASYSVDRNTLIPEKPRIWSANVLANTGSWGNYDLSRDGQRVAALMPSGGLEGQRTQNHIVFLLNFFDELRRRVPPKGL
jgi:serine/threonine-protein kinase